MNAIRSVKGPRLAVGVSGTFGVLPQWGASSVGASTLRAYVGTFARRSAAWDIGVEVEGYPLDMVSDGRRHVCAHCVQLLRQAAERA